MHVQRHGLTFSISEWSLKNGLSITKGPWSMVDGPVHGRQKRSITK
jgi:hypothetical protein